MIEKNSHDTTTKADILLYAGESADSQVLAVSKDNFTTSFTFFLIYLLSFNRFLVNTHLVNLLLNTQYYKH